MVKAIYREREGKDGWKRFLIERDENYGEIDFINPKSTSETNFIPLSEKLYLLDYMKVSCPRGEKLTVKIIEDAIPEEIAKEVFAIEFIMDFSTPWFASLFFEDVEKKKDVAFVALLTKKDTGRALPPRKLTNERPIGISDDDWRRVKAEFYLDISK